MRHIGIDVSKKTLDVFVLENSELRAFANDKKGHAKLAAFIRRLGEVRVVLESTASYGTAVAELLCQRKRTAVLVANPRMTKAFSRSLNMRAKTDSLDAEMLSRFAQITTIQPYVPTSAPLKALRGLTTRRDQLVKSRAKEKVRHAEAVSTGLLMSNIIESMNCHIAFLDGSIKSLDVAIEEHLLSQPDLDAFRTQLTAAKGMALITAATLIAELGHLPKDMTARQMVAYAGLDPRTYQSGKMDAKRRITKRGNKRLRTALYMAAQNTAKSDPNVRAWRQRLLDAGKPPKVANIAVARRLLHAVHGMRKNGTAWDGSCFYQIPEERNV